MTREEAIEILKKLIEAMQGHVTVLPTPERIAAIRLAIASLETDEAYQLEYERTTKNDLGVDREDAVERLNALKQFIGYDEDSEIVKATQKSIDMAISALEHPERNVVAVVPCGDTISRQAVIDLMMQKWGENFSGDDAMQESIDAIRVMPSVTPQPCEDAISRQAVLDLIADYDLSMGQVVRGIHDLPSVTPQLSSGLEKNSKKLENPTKKYCGCCKHWKIKGVQKIGDKPTSYGKCTKLSISGFEVETTFNDNCSSEGLE